MALVKIPLSVVICSLGRTDNLYNCLQSLTEQTFKNFEVIIISDNKIDHFKNLTISWFKDINKGLARARDTGWRKAKGELVSWIDDDVVVEKNWAKEVVSTFDKNLKIGGVTGPTIIPLSLISNRIVFWWYQNKSFLSKLWIKCMLDGDPYQIGKITKIGWWTPGSNFETCLKIDSPIEVDYLEACNMTLRRELVEQVGGFDLHFKGTSEWCEVDLAHRIVKLGKTLIFNPKVRVEHHVSKSGVYKNRHNISERLMNFVRFRIKYVIS